MEPEPQVEDEPDGPQLSAGQKLRDRLATKKGVPKKDSAPFDESPMYSPTPTSAGLKLKDKLASKKNQLSAPNISAPEQAKPPTKTGPVPSEAAAKQCCACVIL